MDKLTHLVIRYARLSWLIIIAIVIGGITVFLTQPRQEEPEIILRSAQVVTRLPGLSPERMEQLITQPIEDKIKTISQIEEMKSLSMTGLSIVTPEIYSRYNNVTEIWVDLRNKMDDLSSQLPEGSIGPKVNDDYGRVAVITLALTGNDFSMAELYSQARDIRDALNPLPLVARVDLYGVQPERVWIDFDAAFLTQFGLSPSKVAAALRTQNIVLPGGSIEAGDQTIVVEPSGNFLSIDDIRRIAIAADNGQVVYLEDIARIRRAYVDPPNAPAYYQGRPALVLGISMVEKSNVVELGHQVKKSLKQIQASLPLGMTLDVVIFQPDLVAASVNNATVNLMQTIVVVLIVVMLVLGPRTGLIVGAMVPLTMMATLIGMSLWGIELHRISIAAIIIALGLLVDNGVVIAEDIKKRLDLGAKRLEAALMTSKTLSLPLLTSSLTTVAAFMPLMLISGGSGEFLRSLGQVLTMALLTSWFIAVTVIPAFCFWFLKTETQSASEPAGLRVEVYDSKAYRLYQRCLEFLLNARIPFVFVMLAALFSSILMFSHIKQRSLGPSERNQFTVYVDLPAGASIHQTINVTQRLSNYLNDKSLNTEVEDVLAYVGGGGPRFFLSLSPNDPQPNKAFLVVNTLTPDQIHPVMKRVEHFLIQQMPEANGRADTLFLGSSPAGTVKLKITGPEIKTLRHLGFQVADVFHSIAGTEGIRNDWENSVLKLGVEVDQERARRADVTSEDIARTLSAYYDGVNLTTYREGELTIPVMLRASSEDRGNLDRLRTVELLSSSKGVPVPLLQVADFEGKVEPSKIRRFNQKRAMTIAGKHPEMTAVELHQQMKLGLDAIEIPSGYMIEVDGEIKDSKSSNRDLFKYAPHALFGILLLLVFQFNSFRRPAVILLTIPLVLIGANYGLFVFNGYFDFTAMLGLFSLAGIIINNGIVLIDKIDQGRNNGLDVDQAIILATLARSRPIIMTTVTTIVGLIPLALFGGEFWYGMAIVIMCGLGIGSLLTLGFVPVLYSLFFNFHGNTKISHNNIRSS